MTNTKLRAQELELHKQQIADYVAALPPAQSLAEAAAAVEGNRPLVALRTRPFIPMDRKSPNELVTGITASCPRMAVHVPIKKWNGTQIQSKEFTGDFVFGPEDKNEEIYSCLVQKRFIDTALGGGVSAVLAYGQTGSGKTYTISSLEEAISNDIFKAATAYASANFARDGVSPESVFEISLSMLELLGAKASDLLDVDAKGSGSDVQVLETKHGDIHITSKQILVKSPAELRDLITKASHHRRTAATQKNATSSRSHCLMTLTFNNTLFPNYESGKLILVDLAGSERAADREVHSKERLEEAQKINESLMALKDCVRARASIEAQNKSGSDTTHHHVGYRHSKLTLALKSVFDLNSTRVARLIIIAHVSPHLADASHSQNTLSYVEPFRVVSTPTGSTKATEESKVSNWTNQQLRSWVVSVSKKIDADKFAEGHTGKSIIDLPEEDFIQRCLDCQKAGEKLEKRGAKKFYLLLWEKTVVHKGSEEGPKRLQNLDPYAFYTYDMQDFVLQFEPLFDGEKFCPAPMKGMQIMELSPPEFVERALKCPAKGAQPTEEDALNFRERLWKQTIRWRTSGRKDNMKRKELDLSAYDNIKGVAIRAN